MRFIKRDNFLLKGKKKGCQQHPWFPELRPRRAECRP